MAHDTLKRHHITVLRIARAVRPVLVREWGDRNNLCGYCGRSSRILQELFGGVVPDMTLICGVVLGCNHWWLEITDPAGHPWVLDLTCTQFNRMLEDHGHPPAPPVLYCHADRAYLRWPYKRDADYGRSGFVYARDEPVLDACRKALEKAVILA